MISEGIDFRDVATAIAIEAARANPPSYFTEPFVPHAWVLDATETAIRAGLTYGVETAATAAAAQVLRMESERLAGDPHLVEIARLQLARDEARAELEKVKLAWRKARGLMHPVIDAAVAWSRDEYGSARDDLRVAVDAYRDATEPF